jgi:hypothetical protein
VEDKRRRPWLSVIAGGESPVSHAGATLVVETARRRGLATELSSRLGRWRRPLATHDPGKIVLDLAVAVARGGDAACDVAVPRPARGVRSGGLGPDGVAAGRPAGLLTLTGTGELSSRHGVSRGSAKSR